MVFFMYIIHFQRNVQSANGFGWEKSEKNETNERKICASTVRILLSREEEKAKKLIDRLYDFENALYVPSPPPGGTGKKKKWRWKKREKLEY